MSIGIAILGAGLFAREEHAPAVKQIASLSLKAIYSRSQASSEALAREHGSDAYYDSPASADRSLDALVMREDIAAVIIALPINTQPNIIRKALSAGKHVLSEKPIAKDCATAWDLVYWYHCQSPKPLWAVAENFRFTEFVEHATKALKDVGGRVVSFSMNFHTLIEDDNKFYNTEWRKAPDYQGGFLLDGGVHFIAGLRALLAAGGETVDWVACFSSLLQKKLVPVDTLHSIWHLRSGSSGSFNCSFGTEFKSGLTLEVVTDKGSVTATPSKIIVRSKSSGGEVSDQEHDIESGSGVVLEVQAFAMSICSGQPDARQTPEEAMSDLQILEAMLRSGDQGGVVQALSR